MQHRVLLLNRAQNYNPGPGLLQGFSGKVYGATSWQHAEGCQGIILTIEAYEVCREDLARAAHLPLRAWQAKFLPAALPVEVMEFAAGYNLAMDGQPLPDEASPAARAGHEIVVWNQATAAHSDGADGEPKVPAEALLPEPPPPSADSASAVLGIDEGAMSAEPIPSNTAWFAVVKAAKQEGLNPDDYTDDGRKTRLIAAINEIRAKKQAAEV